LFIHPLPLELARILAGGTIVFALGLLDDIRHLPPYTKLAGQIAAACGMIALGTHVGFSPHPFVYIPLTLLWIVGITNAFNLLDNMDGLAGGTALISVFFMGVLSQMRGGTVPMEVTVIFLGAIAGFLWFNRNPARIFMGDCGSQWLGFTIACLSIAGSWHNASNLFLMIATPVLILAVPIFDTTLVALNRKIHGRPLSQGGKDHASHRLVALGLGERRTVSILWGLAILFGSIAVFAQVYALEEWTLVTGCAVTFVLVFGLLLGDAKIYPKLDPSPERPFWRLPGELMYKRRIVEIAIDTIVIGGSYSVAYLLRYDWRLGPFFLDQLAKTLPIVLGTKLLVFLVFGLYRGLWTYIDFEGLSRLLRASILASTASILVILGLYRFSGFSRTLFAIDFIILYLLMSGTRALLRALRESIFAFPESGVRILVVGAGDASRYLLAEIRRNRQWNLRPVAIVDDDRRKQGKKILDIPIVGNRHDIPRIVREKSVSKIVIAIPSVRGETLRELIKSCEMSGVSFAVMQSLEDTLIRHLADPVP
jgi:UDP-GlcNAc:undecaprenyl-phosphate/decaprenyl-phosphate GlcNAc-1-phosphate transferase